MQCPRLEDVIPPKIDSCPIRNLPIEIILRAFQLGVEDSLRSDVQSMLESWDDAIMDDEIEIRHSVEDTGIVDSDHGDARFSHSFPVVVSHVCQQWRDAAISTASLWTDIDISLAYGPPYPRIAVFLERSKCLPIDIHIHSSYGFPDSTLLADVRSLYDLLAGNANRWRSIDVKGMSDPHMLAFLCAIFDPSVKFSPQLRSLVLSANQANPKAAPQLGSLVSSANQISDQDAEAQSLDSVPMLDPIFFPGVSVKWGQGWICHASRLTTLELKELSTKMAPSWPQFMSTLRGAPALERLLLCYVQFSNARFLPVTVTSHPNPVQLLKLQHLSLSKQSRYFACTLFRVLYMPAIKWLSLNLFWNDYTQFLACLTRPVTVPATLETEEPPQSLLRGFEALDFCCCFCKREVTERYYDELDNVRSLRLSIDKDQYENGQAQVFPLLPQTSTTDDYGGVKLRLPRLETLFISHTHDKPCLDLVREVVEQRRAAGFPIRSLYLASIEDMDEESMGWFQQNLERFAFSRLKWVGCVDAGSE